MHHIISWNKFWRFECNFRYVNIDESEHYYTFDDVEVTFWNWYQKVQIIRVQRVCQKFEKISQYLHSCCCRRRYDNNEIEIVWNFEKLFIFKEVVWQRENGSIIWTESERSRYWFDKKYGIVIYIVIQFVLKEADEISTLFERYFKQELN